MANKLVVTINTLEVAKNEENFTIWTEISCAKLQLPSEPLTRGLPPPDPCSLCPQMNLLTRPPNKTPGYATVSLYCISVVRIWGTAVAQWSICCATNRKVAGSITDGVIGIFHWHNPSDRTMALGSTQPLTEMSTRSISWGQKAARA